MKLAIIITSIGWGGLEMNVIKLAKHLKEKGNEISLITQEESTINKKGKDFFKDILIFRMLKK